MLLSRRARYHRFKAMPVGDDLKALLLESVRLDLTRQAEARQRLGGAAKSD